MTVLLVEDNPSDVALFGALLEDSHGPWRMEHVDRLAAARERLQTGGIAVVVLDLNLPDVSGAQTVTELRRLVPEIPVVVYTSSRQDLSPDARGCVQGVLRKNDVDGRLIDHALRFAIDRAMLERQLRDAHRLESLGRFTSGIVHDFNNLLTVILGSAAWMLDNPANDAGRHALLTEVVGAAERGASLTRQLLTFARPQAESPAEAVDLGLALADLTPILGRLLGGGVRLDVSVPAGTVAIGRQAQIEQVLINFVANGRDAMPDGGTLTISGDVRHAVEPPAPHLEPGSYVFLDVRDTGVGIAAELLPHIFEPFFTTKPARAGTGLGLAVAAQLVTAAGGAILVNSVLGQGSTFTLALPAAASANLKSLGHPHQRQTAGEP